MLDLIAHSIIIAGGAYTVHVIQQSVSQYYDMLCANATALEALNSRLDAHDYLDAYEPPFDPIPYASDTSVMCGGCGKSVAMRDGFNPVSHNCAGRNQVIFEENME